MNKHLRETQKALELEMYDGGVSRWHKRNEQAIAQGEGASTDWNAKLTKHFIQPLAEGLSAVMEEHEGKRGRFPMALQFLGCSDVHEAAFITIRSMLNAVAIRESTSIQALGGDIASKIEDQVRFSSLRKTDKRTQRFLEKVEDSLKKARSKSYKHKKSVYSNAEKKLGEEWVKWDKQNKLHLGATLIKVACRCIVLWNDETEELEPLFSIEEIDISRGKLRKSSKVLAVTSRYAEWVSEFISNTEAFHPEVGPCVIPPRDWTSAFKGGFHTSKIAARNPLIKMRNKDLMKEMSVAQMPMVYKAVNALQRTEWAVNTEVLDVLQEICEKRIPLAVPDFDEEKKPKNPLGALADEVQALRGDELKRALTPKQYDKFIGWKRKTKKWYDKNRSRVSNVLDLGRTRKIAEKYSLYDKIYFVYCLDFRGRVYARASGLSPQGRDIQKGMLRFANRKALGKHGHWWFKIHGANLWDWDKEDFTTRIANVEEEGFCEMVKSIADDPIKNRSWVRADKPWQFLAWCFEYVAFMKHCESDTSDSFKTFIACAQDGSCSGIQHYSAMLRDEVGGAAVNLIKSPKPNDIYGEVAKVAERKVLADAALDVPYSHSWIAIGITRGLTKTPVMTLPYGSSQLTCRDSVGDYLDGLVEKEEEEAKAEERAVRETHSFGDERWAAEGYMSSHIWSSIGEVVVAARAGAACIRAIAKECAKRNKPMRVELPTGFILEQAVYKTELSVVNTVLEGRIQFWTYNETEEMDVRRMQSGSSPNIIHGMDACHLVMTVCKCVDLGVTDFWVVHDDFGTHARQTGFLHKALRRAMVQLYADNFLEDLWYQQIDHCGDYFEVEIPPFGNLDLNDILESTYIFC